MVLLRYGATGFTLGPLGQRPPSLDYCRSKRTDSTPPPHAPPRRAACLTCGARKSNRSPVATTRKSAKDAAPSQRSAPARNPDSAHEAERVAAIADALQALYPEAHCELDFQDPFQLLVATILSAQSTDKMVNAITPALFARFPDAAALAAADVAEVERLVAKTGFFRQKAKNIVGAARIIAREHGGVVPRTMEELVKLPGVARKTGNVVLGSAYGMNEGIAVDTHVMRLAGRLALSSESDPPKIEQDLLRLFPRERWTMIGHQLIWHGRRVCFARKPACESCTLAPLCPSRGIA